MNLLKFFYCFIVFLFPIKHANATPIITSPLPNSFLETASQTFSWEANNTATNQWWLYVGSRLGGRQYHDSGNLGAATHHTVNRLPNDGSTVYVRLWYYLSGRWEFTDHIFIAATQISIHAPTIISPQTGILTNTSQTFSWEANNTATNQWWLYVGSSLGGRQYHDSGNLGTTTHHTVNSLPSDGSTVYVRLWYYFNRKWKFIDHIFIATTQDNIDLPQIIFPLTDSILTGSDVNIKWTLNNSVTSWWIYAGNRLGSNAYYDSGNITDSRINNKVITQLPTDGSTIYIRLWYKLKGAWKYVDKAYRALPNLSLLNKLAVDSINKEVYIAVNNDGNSVVYKNNIPIRENEFIKTEVVYSAELDKIIYTESSYSNSINQIYINNIQLTSGNTFKKNLLLREGSLYWLESWSNKSYLCKKQINHAVEINCKNLGYVADHMFINGIIITTVGRDATESQRYVISRYNLELQPIDQQTSNNIVTPACRKCSSHSNTLWFVSGYGSLLNLHQQLDMFFGMQYGEPYSFSNDYMGRLSWNQSYRLRSIHKLYLATGISSLKTLYNESVAEILKLANKDYNKKIYSKKYGLNKQQQISFLVDNAIIYYSILEGVEILNNENKKRVIEYAEIMFDSYEKDWHENHYRFPYGESVKYDGIPLPFNQQNAMGLVSIELYKATQNDKYLERSKKLFQYFSNQIINYNGVFIWHYWPQFFYNGWQSHQQISQNTPTLSPYTDILFEDYSHAAINLEFLINASLNLGEEMTIRPEEILSPSLFASGFSRFISGDISYQVADWSFTPSFPWTLFEPVKSLYLRKIYLDPDYDNQDFSNGAIAIDNQGNTAIKIADFYSGEVLFQCNENNKKCKSDLFLFFYTHRNANE